MKEHIYTVDGTELRARYYSDRLELVIGGVTTSLTPGIVKYVRNICNVYMSEFPLDGEVIYQQEETLLTQENTASATETPAPAQPVSTPSTVTP